MNRYEAVNALDLGQSPTQREIRLAYYGIDKAVRTQDFQGEEKLSARVLGLRSHAREARDYLLSGGSGSMGADGILGRVGRGKPKGETIKVSAQEDARARLTGLDIVRRCIASYREDQVGRVRGSLMAFLLCVVVGFVCVRFLRAMPRVAVMLVLVAVIVAASVVLTGAQHESRAARAHLLSIDDLMHGLKVSLGIPDPEYVPPEERERETGPARLWKRVRAWARRVADWFLRAVGRRERERQESLQDHVVVQDRLVGAPRQPAEPAEPEGLDEVEEPGESGELPAVRDEEVIDSRDARTGGGVAGR